MLTRKENILIQYLSGAEIKWDAFILSSRRLQSSPRNFTSSSIAAPISDPAGIVSVNLGSSVPVFPSANPDQKYVPAEYKYKICPDRRGASPSDSHVDPAHHQSSQLLHFIIITTSTAPRLVGWLVSGACLFRKYRLQVHVVFTIMLWFDGAFLLTCTCHSPHSQEDPLWPRPIVNVDWISQSGVRVNSATMPLRIGDSNA